MMCKTYGLKTKRPLSSPSIIQVCHTLECGVSFRILIELYNWHSICTNESVYCSVLYFACMQFAMRSLLYGSNVNSHLQTALCACAIYTVA